MHSLLPLSPSLHLILTLHHPHSTFLLICGSIPPSHINSPSPAFHLFAHLQGHPSILYQLSITRIPPFCSFAGPSLHLISTLHYPHSSFLLICGFIHPPNINSPSPAFCLFTHLRVHSFHSYSISTTSQFYIHLHSPLCVHSVSCYHIYVWCLS